MLSEKQAWQEINLFLKDTVPLEFGNTSVLQHRTNHRHLFTSLAKNSGDWKHDATTATFSKTTEVFAVCLLSKTLQPALVKRQ